MTDADVDGSHIRTLLLTFFFRHMQELIKRRANLLSRSRRSIKVTRKKKVEYVLNDRADAARPYTDLGLDGTQPSRARSPTAAKDQAQAGEIEELLQASIELLGNRLEELVRIIQRRGIDFADFLGRREKDPEGKGRLPQYRVVSDGKDTYQWTPEDHEKVVEGLSPKEPAAENAAASVDGVPAAPAPAVTNGKLPPRRRFKAEELHEVRELPKLFDDLTHFGLTIDDYFLTQEESVSGERLMTRYALKNDEKTIDIAGVAQIMPRLFEVAKQGMEVGRFKGLGEMNSDELWHTTLDPAKRMLLRVTLEEAGEAERMFSVLMGEDVERRRQFIEEHALEVKNLDV